MDASFEGFTAMNETNPSNFVIGAPSYHVTIDEAVLLKHGVTPMEFLGIPVHAADSIGDIKSLVAEQLDSPNPFLVTFVNPSSVAFAERDPAYERSLRHFDLILPDGIGLAKAAEWLHRKPVARISFDSTSLALPIIELAQERGCSVALVGGAPGVARSAAEQMRTAYRDLSIIGTFDGFGDQDAKAREVLALQPDIVVCAMGWGRQEMFLLKLVEMGWRGCGFTCGGYLDQLAGGVQYYPTWVDKANLRWAYRLYKEPRRLWRRYLFDYGRFLRRVIEARLPFVRR